MNSKSMKMFVAFGTLACFFIIFTSYQGSQTVISDTQEFETERLFLESILSGRARRAEARVEDKFLTDFNRPTLVLTYSDEQGNLHKDVVVAVSTETFNRSDKGKTIELFYQSNNPSRINVEPVDDELERVGERIVSYRTIVYSLYFMIVVGVAGFAYFVITIIRYRNEIW